MKYGQRAAAILGACALLLAFQGTAIADELLDRARGLINQKNPKAALDLLSPLEAARAGDVEYDYLLGLAHLDSGNGELAVFALERVLAVNPSHPQARAEIARAFYMLGERENAKREFGNVLAANPPQEVRQTIERFMSALTIGDRQVTGFVEFGLGTDSNVNSATGSGQVAVPALGGALVTLAPGGSRLSDNFMSMAAGINLLQPISEEWSLLAGAAANIRLNGSKDQFDTNSLEGNLGARWTRGQNAVSVSAQAQSFRVDNTRFRDTTGVVAQWQHNISDTRQLSVFAQISDLRYPTQSIRDARRDVFGVGYAQALGGSRNAVVYGSLYGAQENESATGVQHLGHRAVGMRLGGQMQIVERAALFVAFSHEKRNYGGLEPLFLTARADNQTDLRVGVNYRFSPGWVLTPQLSYTDNRSNITINRFERVMASAMLRFEF